MMMRVFGAMAILGAIGVLAFLLAFIWYVVISGTLPPPAGPFGIGLAASFTLVVVGGIGCPLAALRRG